jgi:hypothetical protein
MAYGCNVTAFMRVCTCGEGPQTNLAQFVDYILEYWSLGAPMVTLFHQNDSCGTLSHMLYELVKVAQGILLSTLDKSDDQ